MGAGGAGLQTLGRGLGGWTLQAGGDASLPVQAMALLLIEFPTIFVVAPYVYLALRRVYDTRRWTSPGLALLLPFILVGIVFVDALLGHVSNGVSRLPPRAPALSASGAGSRATARG